MSSEQTRYAHSAHGVLRSDHSTQQPCEMASAFYELCNQAHESNIRRGIHSPYTSTDYEDCNSVSSSGTKPSPGRTEMSPRNRSNGSHGNLSEPGDKEPELNTKYNEEDDENGDLYNRGPIQANMSRKRQAPERYVNYQDFSTGNHFGNLGVELQTLKRQLSLKHASSGRATK